MTSNHHGRRIPSSFIPSQSRHPRGLGLHLSVALPQVKHLQLHTPGDLVDHLPWGPASFEVQVEALDKEQVWSLSYSWLFISICLKGSIHLRAEIAFRAENFGKVFWQVFHAKIFRAEISCRKFWHVAKILAQNFGTEFWHENSMPKLFCAKILSQNFGTVPKLSARNDISAPR